MSAFSGILTGNGSVLCTLPTTVFEDAVTWDNDPLHCYLDDNSLHGIAADGGDDRDIDAFDGLSSPDYADLWYNHFHILPNRINLGNVTSQQIRTIEFFNGFFSPISIDDVTPVQLSGVEIDLTVPEVLAALESIFRDVTVSTVGSPSFDGYFEIQTDFRKIPYYLYVTGQRVLVLPFQHNWTDRILERLAWLNGSSKALDGTEQVVMLRDKPRRYLDYQFLLASTATNAARLHAIFQALMFGWQDKVFIAPIWSDATRLQADAASGQNIITVLTTHFDYDVGSYVMLWRDEETYEVVEIEAVNSGSLELTVNLSSTWPAGRTVVMPARLAYVSQNLQGTRHTPDINTVPVTLEFLAQYPSLNRLVGATEVTYRSLPVLMAANNYVNTHAFSIEREVSRSDSNVGIFRIDGIQPTPDGSNSFSFLMRDHEQAANYFKWLDDRKGRFKAFWQPTWAHDMEVLENIGAAATAFVIDPIGYPSLYYVNGAPAYNRRDVMIRLKNGTYFFRRITGVVLDTVLGHETVSINTALGQIVNVADIDRVSFLIPSALKADAVEVSWESGNVSQSQLVIADVYNADI